MKIAGLILAGGQATRMNGQDKAFLKIYETTCLNLVLSRLSKECTTVAISANGDPARFTYTGCPVLPDTLHNMGPLAGLLSGLQWARSQKADALLSIPVDTPFIPPGLTTTLGPAPAAASWQGRDHPLVALWPVSCCTHLEQQLTGVTDENRRTRTRVRTLSDAIGMRTVDFFPAFPDDPFLNINTPSDLENALQYAENFQEQPTP